MDDGYRPEKVNEGVENVKRQTIDMDNTCDEFVKLCNSDADLETVDSFYQKYYFLPQMPDCLKSYQDRKEREVSSNLQTLPPPISEPPTALTGEPEIQVPTVEPDKFTGDLPTDIQTFIAMCSRDGTELTTIKAFMKNFDAMELFGNSHAVTVYLEREKRG